MSTASDHYHTLGISPGATDDEVKAAYRRMALVHHPDVNGNSAEAQTRFLVIANAYAVLGDPARRAEYDRWQRRDAPPRSRPRPKTTPTPRPQPDPFPNQFNALLWDLEDLLEANEYRRSAPPWDRREFQRDLLQVLAFWDKWVLGPCGFPDHFMEARRLPPMDPRVYVETICQDDRQLVHFPFPSVSGYFYDIRLRMNKLLDRLDRLDLLAEVPGAGVRLADALIEAQNYAVHQVAHLRGLGSGSTAPRPRFVHSHPCFHWL